MYHYIVFIADGASKSILSQNQASAETEIEKGKKNEQLSFK